jgi:hypothetical protein
MLKQVQHDEAFFSRRDFEFQHNLELDAFWTPAFAGARMH